MTKDYAIKMIDRTGRTTDLSINGASIDEMVADGYSFGGAKEEVENNAFANAIAKGLIGEDAWMA